MGKNNKAIFWIGAIIIVLGILFSIPRVSNPANAIVKAWNTAGIHCIGETQQLQQHFHPHLSIFVDGRTEVVEANIGIVPSCTAEIHTHDISGNIHIESPSRTQQFLFKDFLTVWGKAVERPGFTASITVDGQPASDLEHLALRDEQQIIIRYVTNPQR